MAKLDWVEESTLAGMFYRAWTDEISASQEVSDKPYTQKELKRWMDAAEKKIRAGMRRVRAKEMRRELDAAREERGDLRKEEA